MTEKLIFEHSRPGRRAYAQAPQQAAAADDIPAALRRAGPPPLPELSELEVVRHYTRLSQRNFSIDTHFYPLGSCTMKYNPRACHTLALLPGFAGRHPLAPESHSQGFLACMYELQEILKEVTGMKGVSLTPMAGAQGEFAGVAMMRAYHQARGDTARTEVLVPDAAHGTNPATATMCGGTVREIPTDANGDVDVEKLRAAVGPQTMGIMLTNPSTLGVFERRIKEIAAIVHEAGGLLYYDGANLNAILGKVRPGDMGFDVIHMNLHKTFSTPHGGGGPGSGAVGVSQRLLPFLPIPVVGKCPHPNPPPQAGEGVSNHSSPARAGERVSNHSSPAHAGEGVSIHSSTARAGKGISNISSPSQAEKGSSKNSPSPRAGEGALNISPSPRAGEDALNISPPPLAGEGEGGGAFYRWLDERDLPQSIGRLSAFMGNAGVLLRAYVYARMLGRDGMHRVGEFATLNANYLMARLRERGFDLAFPSRRASHEFIVTLRRQKQEIELTATDVAKRLLDYGFHAPTVYFPLLVPECLLIEPTETETRETLDAFVDAMSAIWDEAKADIGKLKGAPYTTPVRRLDDVRAARQLDIRWNGGAA